MCLSSQIIIMMIIITTTMITIIMIMIIIRALGQFVKLNEMILSNRHQQTLQTL